MLQINSFINRGSLITRPNISLPAIDSSRAVLRSMALDNSEEGWMVTMQAISMLVVFLIPLLSVLHRMIPREVKLESRIDPDDLECMKRRVQRVLNCKLNCNDVSIFRSADSLYPVDDRGFLITKGGTPICKSVDCHGSDNWVFSDERYDEIVFKAGSPALNILTSRGIKRLPLTGIQRVLHENMELARRVFKAENPALSIKTSSEMKPLPLPLPLPLTGRIRARYENMELARRVCAREKLDLIYIPRARSFEVDALGERYFVIAQERLKISKFAGVIAADYVERLTDEHVKQLVKLIALTHMNNVDYLNFPMLEDGRIALFSFKKCGSLEEGFLGDSCSNNNGLFRLMPTEKKVELAFNTAVEFGFEAPEGTLEIYTNMCRKKLERWERHKKIFRDSVKRRKWKAFKQIFGMRGDNEKLGKWECFKDIFRDHERGSSFHIFVYS